MQQGHGDDFQSLLTRFRAGDDAATRDLYDRYSGHISRVVRTRLQGPLRRLYDSDDFLQSVWRSFFVLPRDRYDFDSAEAMVAFLGQIAANKVAETHRKRVGTAKHDLGREKPFAARGDGTTVEPPGADPTPSHQAMQRDDIDALMRSQPDRVRRMLDMIREGYTRHEIAGELGMGIATIDRMLRQLREGRR